MMKFCTHSAMNCFTGRHNKSSLNTCNVGSPIVFVMTPSFDTLAFNVFKAASISRVASRSHAYKHFFLIR